MDCGYNLERLPKWAQDIIRQLEGEASRLRNERDAARGTVTEDTRIIANPERSPYPLPAMHWIRFILDGGDHIDVKLRDDKIELMGDSTLQITPWVTNVIYVGTKPR